MVLVWLVCGLYMFRMWFRVVGILISYGWKVFISCVIYVLGVVETCFMRSW